MDAGHDPVGGPPGGVDWAATPLGSPTGWPSGLAAVVSTVFGAPLPMALAYGPRFALLYNEPYARLLGSKHPWAFARPAAEVLAENWSAPGHGDMVERVFRTGEPFLDPDTRLPVRRGDGPDALEDVHFTRAYTAARDDAGRIVGVLTVVSELTQVARALTGIAQLAAALSSAVGVDDVVRETLRYAVDVLGADHARVLLSEGPTMRMARATGPDLRDDSFERLPPLWSRVPPSARLPSVQVIRSGEPLWLEAADVDAFPGITSELAGHLSVASVASVPLHTGPVEGALSVAFEARRPFSEADRAALVTVGKLIGQALGRAQRFDEQRDNAQTLQRSLLPADLPVVPGLAIAARYLPSGPGTSAGGDFYDAFVLPDGRVVVAIGDVVGHGVLAAAVMGQVRAGLRVLALRDPDPVAVLAGLDPFVASLGTDTFVTALVGVVDVASGAMTAVTAGHPPPLLRRHAGADESGCDFLPLVPAPPLGIPAQREPVPVALRRGDALVLYTDGLVEVPGEDIGTGLERLRSLVAERPDVADPRRLCSLVLDRMGTGDDDIAVIVASLDEGVRRTASLEFPAESGTPAAARTWADATLAGWALGADVRGAAVLALSELVTNALLHARSGCRVDLDLDDDRLLVLVTDAGTTTMPRLQAPEPTALRGRGLTVVDSIADAWGSERSGRGTTVWFELLRRPGRG